MMSDQFRRNTSSQPRILVIGQRGQLAQALKQVAPADAPIVFAGRGVVDLTRPDTIAPAIQSAAPDVVINAAALTDVDAAEADQALALTVNSHGPGMIAAAADAVGAAFLHLSSSYVFDGDAGRAYREDDRPAPLNIYGATKLLGEELALSVCPRTVIVRSSWVYAPGGRFDPQRFAGQPDRHLVQTCPGDETSSPTSTLDLARVCLSIATRMASTGSGGSDWGVVHAASQGACSRTEFVSAALLESAIDVRAELPARVDWPIGAPRPRATPLDSARLRQVFGLEIGPWRDGLSGAYGQPELRRAAEVA